jgi:hypothetical protein
MNNITLNIVSFNIWNDPYYQKERLKWIKENILKNKYDIILFQEVNNNIILELTKKLRKLNYNYKISNNKRNTYEIICSIYPIINYKFQKFSNSNTNKGLLWITIRINNKNILIANTQLEQTSNTLISENQLKCVFNFLSQMNNINNIILGCDIGKLSNISIDNKWNDAWITNGKNKYEQYTYNSYINKNIILLKNKHKQIRSDRIYYTGNFIEPELRFIGTIPINNNIYPSTHFGLHLKITLIN